MWPWEHLAVGYLCYSLLVHLFGRRAPRAWPAVALAVGTQFPDLVDKPLAWTFGVLPSGHSLAHSAFAAVPAAALAVTVAWALGRPRVGAAFGFGYLSHLPGDVIYPVLIGGEADYGFLFWPLVPAEGTDSGVGFLEMVRYLLARYRTELAQGEVATYLAVEVGLMASVALLWLYDGAPPLGSVWARLRLGRPAEEPR
ncbi:MULTISPECIES: metal-dependent hydrolase [Halorussus]|uniref:metal-dependent hydrolase n=1 Tax=Halorussus TaxID=1070314 RepID=UPI000E21606D|nr:MULTISPECIES: metal-dependent hydrolase [Halorussus]NHN59134.1 metal-dependent hydrolase [Halorussus sp. JP-T4]